MKPTENYEQLLARFTKRMAQVESKFPTKNIEESEKLNNKENAYEIYSITEREI